MQNHEPVSDQLLIVVDDDSAVRNSLKFSLELEGYAVRAFATGADLLNAADVGGCACLIVDQNLPGMTGLDLVGELRSRQVLAPVILITSHPTAIVINRAAHAGVPIVEKPLLGDALLERICATIDAVARMGPDHHRQ